MPAGSRCEEEHARWSKLSEFGPCLKHSLYPCSGILLVLHPVNCIQALMQASTPALT